MNRERGRARYGAVQGRLTHTAAGSPPAGLRTASILFATRARSLARSG